MKKRVVHYTIGYHYPYRGGVETAIGDVCNMTSDNFEHIIVNKHAGHVVNGIQTICGISQKTRKNGKSSECQKYNEIGEIPLETQEFDEETINIINSLNPDIFILYGNDCRAMYIPFIKCNAKKKILRLQAYTQNEVDIIKEYLLDIEII